jgi:hypothetical protein
MAKSILALYFLFSLVFSILSPSVSNLLNLGYDEIVLIDSTEEESQKEVESSIDEDIIIIKLVSKFTNCYLEEDSSVLKSYSEVFSMYASTVYLPPPELSV